MVKKGSKKKKRIRILNRQLSWLDFNSRVLEEASKPKNPLMERLRFLMITASNLDEFFMVQVGSLRQIADAGYQKKDASGMPSALVLEEVLHKAKALVKQQYRLLRRELLPELRAHGIWLVHWERLSKSQRRFAQDYFDRAIFPILTVIVLGDTRPFPKLAGKTKHVWLRFYDKREEEMRDAILPLPISLPELLKIRGQQGDLFLPIEEIIVGCFPRIFPGCSMESWTVFRITRNADIRMDEDAADLLGEVERCMKKRKAGFPVRLELRKPCDSALRAFLAEAVKVRKRETFAVPELVDIRSLAAIEKAVQNPSLRFPAIQPVSPPADFWGCTDMFAAIRERDRMVSHPYESFDCVVEFIRQAAEDTRVLAIKQTLYRVSEDSPVMEALIHAAQCGKAVTVLVELKARFDEAHNAHWAQKLESAGCSVIYGIPGLKTHCKVLMVMRQESDGIRTYLHLATGNYNDVTARLYTDIGMFTCRKAFGADAAMLFRRLTGGTPEGAYQKLKVAPESLRAFFIEMIEREIAHAKQNRICGITAKVNALADREVIARLCRASKAGVPVRLLVRGICCILPDGAGIEVHSIVGRFLEHSRIFQFENGGSPELYLGSADLLPRNLDRRIEVVFPVEDARLKLRLRQMLTLMLRDTVNTRIMQTDGSYLQLEEKTAPVDAQRRLCAMAEASLAQAKQQGGNQYETNRNLDSGR